MAELTQEVTVAEPLVALRRMAELAERSVGSCDAVAVSVMEDGGATTVATAETAKRLNAAQYRFPVVLNIRADACKGCRRPGG